MEDIEMTKQYSIGEANSTTQISTGYLSSTICLIDDKACKKGRSRNPNQNFLHF